VVVLADMHDASYEEIAETLEIPVGTVRSRLHRGRTELRTLLAAP
jgi:RNA polymerase sigma-70 factor (ECF subfamily)